MHRCMETQVIGVSELTRRFGTKESIRAYFLTHSDIVPPLISLGTTFMKLIMAGRKATAVTEAQQQ